MLTHAEQRLHGGRLYGAVMRLRPDLWLRDPLPPPEAFVRPRTYTPWSAGTLSGSASPLNASAHRLGGPIAATGGCFVESAIQDLFGYDSRESMRAQLERYAACSLHWRCKGRHEPQHTAAAATPPAARPALPLPGSVPLLRELFAEAFPSAKCRNSYKSPCGGRVIPALLRGSAVAGGCYYQDLPLECKKAEMSRSPSDAPANGAAKAAMRAGVCEKSAFAPIDGSAVHEAARCLAMAPRNRSAAGSCSEYVHACGSRIRYGDHRVLNRSDAGVCTNAWTRGAASGCKDPTPWSTRRR